MQFVGVVVKASRRVKAVFGAGDGERHGGIPVRGPQIDETANHALPRPS